MCIIRPRAAWGVMRNIKRGVSIFVALIAFRHRHKYLQRSSGVNEFQSVIISPALLSPRESQKCTTLVRCTRKVYNIIISSRLDVIYVHRKFIVDTLKIAYYDKTRKEVGAIRV